MTPDAKGSVDPNVTRDLVLNSNAFPCTIPTLSLGLNDVGYQQKILANPLNYSAAGSCEVFDIRQDGICKWTGLRSEEDFRNHLTRLGLDQSSPNGEATVLTRIIFVALKAAEGATFGGQISLSQSMTDLLLQSVTIRPEYIPMMFGQFGGNHLPPGHFQHHDQEGELSDLDFICQQPRWGFRVRQWPISTWMRYSRTTNRTTCIISHGADDPRISSVQIRLASSFNGVISQRAARSNAVDPFLLPTMISHECFMQSDSSVFDLGSRLYSALDVVDKVNETQYNRQELESVTFKLHQVSQDADSLIQSSDIAISIMERMREAQETLSHPPNPRTANSKHFLLQPSIDATNHLTHAIYARRRWLSSAKSRKDTTMTLLYALVAQKEATTSIAIARDTKADSSSMKAIAALTMVFLPAMAVTSFFGMGFFDFQSGKFHVASEVWVFAAVSVPLTVATVVVWWVWDFFVLQRSTGTGTAVLRRDGGVLVPGVLGKLIPASAITGRVKVKDKEEV